MQEPAHEIKMKIGPVLATEYRQITPAALLASHVFLKSMITRGCRNCVLELKKVQYALRKYLTKEENKPFLGSWDLEECVEKWDAIGNSVWACSGTWSKRRTARACPIEGFLAVEASANM